MQEAFLFNNYSHFAMIYIAEVFGVKNSMKNCFISNSLI